MMLSRFSKHLWRQITPPSITTSQQRPAKCWWWLVSSRSCVTSSSSQPQSIRSIIDSEGLAPVPRDIVVKGWVKSVRKHRNLLFLHVNDGSCQSNIQVVADDNRSDDDIIVHYDSAVEIKGQLVESPARQQKYELRAAEINVIGDCDPLTYPFDVRSHHPVQYVRQYPHLRSRRDFFNAILRVRSKVMMHLHKFFQERSYVHITTPVISSSDCEGGGELFNVNSNNTIDLEKTLTDTPNPSASQSKYFFDVPTYLTVSGQLHLETAIGGFDKVYTFGPTFRAENSQTRHHLSEFYMVEAELAFTESLTDITAVMQDCLKTVVESTLRDCSEELETVSRSLSNRDNFNVLTKIQDNEFITLSYTEAVEILSKTFSNLPNWGDDLQKEHEKFLVEHCDGIPVLLVDFPQSLKPFYARRNGVNGNRPTVSAVDMLVPGVGELFGGSLREERLDELRNNIKILGMKEMDWYSDLRRFGSVPHGGFGMGFERLLQLILGVTNIRDTIPFPRFPHSCQL